MRSNLLCFILGAGLLGFAHPVSVAHAGTVLVFGQAGISDNFTATNDGATGALGGTKLSALNIEVVITGIANSSPLPGSFPFAFLNLSATSTSNAMVSSGHITEDFSGSFSITSMPGDKGVNYLSGTFVDTVFGSGTGLTLTGTGAGVPTFTSDVISTLAQARAISLSFTDVTPASFVTSKDTLGAFTSNVSGNFSAAGVPEPGSIVLLGISATGFLAFRRRFKSSAVA